MTTVAANLEGALAISGTEAGGEAACESCFCGFATTKHEEVYNEPAFHHFLAIERKRSEASTRPFLLLLVEFEKHFDSADPIGPEMAARLFECLAASLRDTDVIGWYRDQRIVGAVLTDLGDAPQAYMPAIRDRVRAVFRHTLPRGYAELVRPRIYQLASPGDGGIGTSARSLELA